jgi:hypothetical protein
MPAKKNADKEFMRKEFLRAHSLSPHTRAMVLFDIEESEMREFFLRAASSLNIALIPLDTVSVTDYAAFDACISLREGNSSFWKPICLARVAPITLQSSTEKSLFSEFDPMKFSGNAFLFGNIDRFLIFEKLIRFLENIRYPGDRRILLENIEKTAREFTS